MASSLWAMSGILRRLALGIILIAATSALLLFSDMRSRVQPRAAARNPSSAGTDESRHVRVALLQHASQSILDEGRRGVMAGLAERGWVEGKNLSLKYYNAEGDMPVAQAIAKEMVSGGYDLLLTISSVSMQSVANANRATRVPHVFALVSDPYAVGAGISRENHLDHPPYIAGYGTMQPIEPALKTARAMNPALATVGIVWNAAESNSVSQLKVARKVCAGLGLKLLESTVDNSAGVAEATGALVARGVDALLVVGDVTVLTAIDSVIATAKKGRIPVFTVIPPNSKRGALFDLGADYSEVGRISGNLAGDILNGRNPATVPIDNVLPEVLDINLKALDGLKAKWTVPDSLRSRARLLIDERGVAHSQGAPNAPAGQKSPEPGHTYRIAFAAYSPDPGLEACQKGLLDGLSELGFVEGKNLTVRRTHAQGEMMNIPQMIQNLDHTDADVIVPFSTPVLQGAIAAVKTKPVVFTFVTDPLAAGAGKTYEDHIPFVTGIGSLPPIDDTVAIIRRVLPDVKRLGTIYNASEANSVKIISILRESTRRAGLELVEITAANSNDVLEAAQALVARRVDAIYVPGDNTAYLAFDAIVKVSTSAELPLIIDDPDHLVRGGLFACGPGFYYSGKAAAPLLARVLLGESPAKIPMANVSVNVTKFNPAVIAKLGLKISPELVHEIEMGAAAPKTRPAAAASPNPTGKKWKIALVLYNETPPAEQTLEGMRDAWKRSKLVEGRDYEITLRSAQGDMSALGGILDAAVTDGSDIIVPLSTPTLQAAVHRVKGLPIVFSLVGNPMVAGAGKSYTDHLPNVTGITVIAPTAEVLDLIQKYFPEYKRLGTLFCPAEANSVFLKETLETLCKERGLTLDSIAANTASELPDAALALAASPIDAILQLSDNLTSGGFTAIAHAARQSHKPLFSLNSTTVALGAAVGMGRDYYNGGEATTVLLERVIAGEKPADIPFAMAPKINYAASIANARAVGMTLPPAFLREIAAANEAAATKPAAAVKKWKIAVVLYNETPPAEEILQGMKEAWKRSSFVEGRDYEIKLRSAQGDMALLNGILDAALTDGADMVVTLSTPTLQIAVHKVKRVPVVFTLVTDPMAAGAGKSYTDHIPNVTGIAVLAPVGEALDMIQKYFPSYKRLGTVYCPAEANAVFLKETLEAACKRRGLTLGAVAANTSSELSDAALALVSRPIDAILQIPDALSSAGFSAITRAARQSHKPLLALNSTVVPLGAAIGFSRDFHNAGEATVALIERVLRGEDVARIPFDLPPKIVSMASIANARAVGMTLPPALLKDMDKVVP